MIDLVSLREKANSLCGCLAEQRTTTSRRRDPLDEDMLDVKNPFVSDEAKILSSKAYRMLDRKTQVFTLPSSPLTRTRGAHVREVQAVSVIATEMLGLNTDLVRAASIGHDIGHVPLGHCGEEWIAKKMGKPFCHEKMGVITAQFIERKGAGLNLCFETLEAMMRHSGNTAKEGMSPEAWTLRHTDKATYIPHDINDILRAGHPLPDKLMRLVNEFGVTQRDRTTTAIAALVIESAELGRVSFSQSELGMKFNEIRTLMYEVYVRVTQQNVDDILGPVLDFLEMLKLGDPFLLLALMTDEDVLRIRNWTGMKDMHLLNQTSVREIIPFLEEIGSVDMCDPKLDW